MAEIVSLEELSHKINYLRSKKKDLIVVATNGCFDILHVGHIRSLQKAKTLGDILVVGINSDTSVKKLKGKNRPVNIETDRLEILAALSSVDFVSVFSEDTAEKFLNAFKPNIYVKGAEYAIDNLPEAQVVKKLGGSVVKIPMIPGSSTTSIIEKLKTLDY